MGIPADAQANVTRILQALYLDVSPIEILTDVHGLVHSVMRPARAVNGWAPRVGQTAAR